MNRLLEQAIAEAAALPEDQQEEVARGLLDEIRRRALRRGKWARVADDLARLNLFEGRSEAFARHTRAFRDGFRLRGTPDVRRARPFDVTAPSRGTHRHERG